MSSDLLMGLDLGGGGCRCLLVELGTRRWHAATRAIQPRPRPEVAMAVELDAGETWRSLGEVTREVLERFGAAPDQITAIAATSMRHGSVVVGEDGVELLMTPNRDARGMLEMLELAGQEGRELHRRTGHWPNPIQPAGRLLWLARHAPDTLARAHAHLSLSDWLAFRMCGATASEPSQAGESLLFDLDGRGWAWDLIDRFALPRRLFPEIREAGTRLGELHGEAAEALGLRPGIPVAVGGADTQCGLLGAGVVSPGEIGAVAGTSTPVQRVLDRAVIDGEARLWAGHHVVPGRWVIESNAGGMGEALDWIAGLLYPAALHPVVQLLAEAASSPPGAAGILSTFGAEVMNARHLGVPTGDLTLSYMAAAKDPARRCHLVRAVIEGMAYALRANIEQTDTAAGARTERLRLAGGLSRNATFTQLVADVLGQRVEVPAAAEASALGAAICAGVGAGLFSDLAEGAHELVELARLHEPDPERAAVYGQFYESWTKLRDARQESDALASAMTMRGLAGAGASDAPREGSDFRPHILVTADMDESALEALRRMGDVDHRSYRQAMRMVTGPSLAAALEGVHVFVTEIDVVDASSLAKARDLRLVVTCRGDAVNVDLEAATALGIPVLHTPGRNADAVADLAVAFMLMLARRLPEASAFLREPGGEAGDMGRMAQAFGRLQGRELWRKTVGLVGLGAIGRKVVARLRPFGVRCLVYDPHIEPDAARLAGAEPAGLDELLRASDIVTLHAAVTEASRGLIGARELALLRPGSLLVNTARAALIDEEALVEALRSGPLGGAAVDVFAVEPPGSDHPLLAMENVITTPHIGGNTLEVAAHQGRIVAEELERLRRGRDPRHCLNPQTLGNFRWSEPRPEPSPQLLARLGRGPGPAVSDLQKGAARTASREAARVENSAPALRRQERAEAVKIREGMQEILRAFTDRIVADERLREFAASGQDASLHFTLSDLDLDFYFGFREGSVVAGLGVPPAPASVQLKMKADLLDGMFTGRRNAMQASINGELSFSGDAAKAMTLSHIQRDLSRLYRAVREELGDPGDLSAIPDAKGASPGARAAQQAVGSDDPRQQLIEVVNELYATQLITSTGGNVSARAENPNEAWITPSQLFKGDLRPEILVRIGMDGRALDPDARSPSSEALMHAAVLSARPEAQAVIHCHAPNATILANTDLPFLPISTEAAFFKNIGRIPFIMPGTQELADAVVEALADGWAVLMQNHGLLVAGRSLRRAADMCEIIERTAQVIIGCYAVGKEPPTLPEETVEMLAKYGDLMA